MRAWGGRARQPLRRLGGLQSTPTCVGRGMYDRGWQTFRAPRVRGEDESHGRHAQSPTGAPPRAWGGRRLHPRLPRHPRSTPTCVGRTAPTNWATTAHRSTPHVRGEDDQVGFYLLRVRGAPPRAWGGRELIEGPLRGRRSTPTCVGRTPPPASSLPPAAEHPHVRGEDQISGCVGTTRAGAPPRAWGGRHSARLQVATVRSTPTCVGRTPPLADPRLLTAEHPHVRGEDGACRGLRFVPGGAPPRAWGGRPSGSEWWTCRRSTPTCVGRTSGGRG